tara:strand:- start:126 stop:503 length:378 start_codon:yes stop_codon:yes gene_type:complete
MNKSQCKQQFNINLERFLNELMISFPNETQSLKSIQAKINVMNSLDSNQLIKNWIGVIKPYKDQLFSKNESFFINNQLSNNENDNILINKIKHIWLNNTNISQKTKNAIFDYGILLTKLAEMYNS